MENVCIYGNPTLDYIVFSDKRESIAYGGGVYYSSLPFLKSSKYDVGIYAVYSPRIHGHPIYRFSRGYQYSSRTTIFRLIYSDSSRALFLEEKAPPLYPWIIHEEPCLTIVNPVFHEVNESNLALIRIRSPILAGDVQGFIRGVRSNMVIYECSRHVVDSLRYFDIIHMDEVELKALTCMDDTYRALKKLKDILGGTIVVVTNRTKPIHVLLGNTIETISLDDSLLVRDKTGAGDYFLGALLKHVYAYSDFLKVVEKAHEETSMWLKEKNASSPPTTFLNY